MYLTHLRLDGINLLPELKRTKRAEGPSKDSEKFLKESIKIVGMREPLLVNENRELIDGYRRYYAIKDLQKLDMLPPSIDISKIPCIIASTKAYNPADLRIQSDVRQDLTPSQEAYYYGELFKTRSINKNDLAKMIGISPMSISNYMVILDCIDAVKKAIDSKQFPMSAGKIFCVLNADGQKKLYDKLIGNVEEFREFLKIPRQRLINEAKRIDDSFFKRPKTERMKKSRSLRERKRGQIQDGGIKRDLILHDISMEEKELSYVERQLEKARMKLQGVIRWLDLVIRNKALKDHIKSRFPEQYNDITFVLHDELGGDYN